MGVFAGPNIVEDGLVLALDAANTKSYSGSGTTWNDLSGNGNHGTNANMTFETDKGGVFDFNNSNSESTIANSDSLNPVSQLTLEAVVNFDGNSNDFIFEKGNVNSQYSIFSHSTDLVFRTVHQGVAGYDSLYAYKTQGITNGQYHHVLGSYNGSTKKTYIDGREVATKNKTGNLVTTTPGASVGDFGGASTGYPFGGKIALVRVYNIGLTASQVKQNFEAVRSRFGL